MKQQAKSAKDDLRDDDTEARAWLRRSLGKKSFDTNGGLEGSAVLLEMWGVGMGGNVRSGGLCEDV